MNRPTSVTVLGILNIVFAAFGLMGIAFYILMMFVPSALNAKNPVLDLMQKNPGYVMYVNISTFVGALFTIMKGVSGIGLLMLRPWGRWLSICYSIYTIFIVLVNSVVSYYFLYAPMLDKMAGMPSGPDKVGMSMGIVGGIAGFCIGPIYPVILLIFMFRPNVKAAFGTQISPDQFRF